MVGAVDHGAFPPLNLTYAEEKRLPAAPLWVSLPADHGQHAIQLIGFHKNVTSL